jgi:acyl-CoA thioester hydrolase
MEKIKIEIPTKVLFITEFKISTEDINEADHMGNERILHHANLVRYDFFEAMKLSPENEHGLIIASHSIQYRSEGFLGDTIICEISAGNLTECTFDLYMHFIKSSTQKTLAAVRSGMVYFNYQHRKIRHLPQAFVTTLSA